MNSAVPRRSRGRYARLRSSASKGATNTWPVHIIAAVGPLGVALLHADDRTLGLLETTEDDLVVKTRARKEVEVLVYDNALWRWNQPPEDLRGWMETVSVRHQANRVAVVGTGIRALPWGQAFVATAACSREISLHVTTTAEALADGFGRRVARAKGETWTPAFDRSLVERLRRLDPLGIAYRLD